MDTRVLTEQEYAVGGCEEEKERANSSSSSKNGDDYDDPPVLSSSRWLGESYFTEAAINDILIMH